jgi:hypothetical protein
MIETTSLRATESMFRLGRRWAMPRRSREASRSLRDVVGLVGEHPAGVLVALPDAGHGADGPVDDPAAVRVEETAEERAGVLVDDRLLPRLEGDRAGVFLAGTVLRKQARPVFRA